MNQPTHQGPQPPLIAGYRDLTLIAEGGFSSVYTAYQDTFSRTVAIKVLHTDAHDPAAQQQFQHECQLTGRLTGRRHTITVFDAGITLDQRPFIAMQYLPNGSLADRLAAEGPLPVLDVLNIGAAIAGALDAAHAAGILHRDVKPGNILVSDDGEPVLSDFGIASLTDPTGDPNSIDAFTVAHTAPEVLEGAPSTVRSDIYALGSTLYTLLAGVPPFDSHSGQTTMYRVLQVRKTQIPEFGHLGLPAGVGALLRRTLAADPEQRPSTFAELAAELAALRDDPEHGADPSPPTTPAAGTAVLAEHRTTQVFAAPTAAPYALAPPVPEPRPTLPNHQPGKRRVMTIVALAVAAALIAFGAVVLTTLDRQQAAGQAVGQGSVSGSATTTPTSATSIAETTSASGAVTSETPTSPSATSVASAVPGAFPNAPPQGTAANPAPDQQTPVATPGPPAAEPGPNPSPGHTYTRTPYSVGSAAPNVHGELIWYNRSVGATGTMQSQSCSNGSQQNATATVYTSYDSHGNQQARYETPYTCGSTNISKTLDGSAIVGGLTKVIVDLYVNGKLMGRQICPRPG